MGKHINILFFHADNELLVIIDTLKKQNAKTVRDIREKVEGHIDKRGKQLEENIRASIQEISNLNSSYFMHKVELDEKLSFMEKYSHKNGE